MAEQPVESLSKKWKQAIPRMLENYKKSPLSGEGRLDITTLPRL